MTLHADASGRRNLSSHILGASVVMIGVSTTLVGLVKFAKARLLPACSSFSASGTSYLSIRYGNGTGLGQRCEQIADLLFVVGLIGISTISIFFAGAAALENEARG